MKFERKIKYIAAMLILLLAIYPFLQNSAFAGVNNDSQPLPAFPGAQGFGTDTPGGRGGVVVLVTNLNDDGPGSLRAACRLAEPRIVVFRVSGIIDLDSTLVVDQPFITIAGQSAPGSGICLRRSGLSIRTHDVVVRHIRSRPGDLSGRAIDALSIGGDSRRVVLDHCSASWSVDETLSPSGRIGDITIQWCLISESLNYSVHPKGAHGYGSLSRAIGGVSWHHNLWAHHNARNPRLGDAYGEPPWPRFDVRNNVMYNYGAICSGMTGGVMEVNYVANAIRPGPDSRRSRPPIVMKSDARTTYYISGNLVFGNSELTDDNEKFFDRVAHAGFRLVQLADSPFDVPAIQASDAAVAFEQVLAGAGAICPARDSVDRRIVDEVKNGSGRLIDSQWEVGGWPGYPSMRPPADSDRDGMPDQWEKAAGLDPRDPSDSSSDRNGDGYSNIEEYLNELTKTINRR